MRKIIFALCGVIVVGAIICVVSRKDEQQQPAGNGEEYFYQGDYDRIPRVRPGDFPATDIRLSDLVEDFQVVKLDSENVEAMVGNYSAPTISENFIGIKTSEPNKAFGLYDRATGKFVRKIGEVGRGPGEYSGLYDWVIDEPGDRVYLVPFAQSTILEYDLDGKFLGSIAIPGMDEARRKTKIEVRGDVITAYTLPFPGDSIVVRTFTKAGRLTATARNPFGGARSFDNELYINKGAQGYQATNVPIYYRYEAGALTPAFGIESDGKWTGEVYESPSWLLVKVFHLSLDDSEGRPKDYWLAENKLSGERSSGELVNDFLGGIETTNSSYPDRFYIDHYFAFENGWYLELVPAVVLKRLLGEALSKGSMAPEVRARVETLNDSFDEDDNHFLFYGKLK